MFCYNKTQDKDCLLYTSTEAAEKRLNAIREFTEFGSGFRVAMRDLEIRGAGNLLGAEQSGFMASVGYDLYVKMIEETVREMRGDVSRGDVEARVELKVDAYLPQEYVPSDVMRVEMYKKIASIRDRAGREDLIEEPVSYTHLDVYKRQNVDRTRVIAIIFSTVLAGLGHLIFAQNIGSLQTYGAHEQVGLYAGAAILVGGASIVKASNGQALLGCLLFHLLFIVAILSSNWCIPSSGQ